jgi:hypothetical protein
MESTACLVGPDAAYVELTFKFLPVRQHDMQENNPIACHSEGKTSLVAAGADFLGVRKDRSHAGVCHVCLDRNMCPRDCFGIRTSHLEGNYNRSDLRGRWRDFVLDFNRPRRIR